MKLLFLPPRTLFRVLLLAPVVWAFAADLDANGQEGKLKGKRVAILLTDGFEEVEMVAPRKALDAAGAKTTLIAPHKGEVRAWNSTEWGQKFKVDATLDQANPEQFDALLLPGGVINPDKLRLDPKATQFVKAFFDKSKPVAAICHGPVMLIEAGVVSKRRLTSWPSLKTDLRNAGATWEDAEVVVDHGLVTSRKPSDIPAFNEKMIEQFSAGKIKASASAR